MSDWLKKHHEAVEDISICIVNLQSIGSLLYNVGLDKLEARVNGVHNKLSDALEKLQESMDENLDEGYKRAQESSANVLKACLAGIQLEKEKYEK